MFRPIQSVKPNSHASLWFTSCSSSSHAVPDLTSSPVPHISPRCPSSAASPTSTTKTSPRPIPSRPTSASVPPSQPRSSLTPSTRPTLPERYPRKRKPSLRTYVQRAKTRNTTTKALPPHGLIDASFSTTASKLPDNFEQKSNSFLAEVLNQKPELFQQLKTKSTKLGVTLQKCIKPGVDASQLKTPEDSSFHLIKQVGIIAGDAESYQVFRDLFDPIIKSRHELTDEDAHVTNMDPSLLSRTRIDPTCSADGRCTYSKGVRVQVSRNIDGFRFPPALSFEERRQVEHVASKALINLNAPYSGEYHPLQGSKSVLNTPVITNQKKQELEDQSLMFKPFSSPGSLSAGLMRHWPDGRGVFQNRMGNLICTVNETDHVKMVATEKGDGIRMTFRRCCEVRTNADGAG